MLIEEREAELDPSGRFHRRNMQESERVSTTASTCGDELSSPSANDNNGDDWLRQQQLSSSSANDNNEDDWLRQQ